MDEQEQRSKVVEVAVRYLGTPYRHMGRSTGGMDCVHLPLEAFEQAGITPHRVIDYYPEDWAMHNADPRYVREMEAFGMRKVGREPKPGDMAMFTWGLCISHGALVVEWPRIIHAYKPAKAVVYGNATKGALAKRFAGIWSYWE